MTFPRVSVVMAAHDQAAWIGAAIGSVRAQTLPDWELVIVNDGSTDDTAAVVAGFLDDRRIRYLPGPHRERAAARNRGIAAAAAPLVAFLDADDLWRPEKLARQVAALDTAPDAALCYTVARYVDAGGRPLPVRRPPRPVPAAAFAAIVRANRFILASVVVRRAALDAVGGFDETLSPLGCEDWDLWLRLTRRFPIAAVPEELTLYRRHGANTAWRQILASGLAVLDRLYADPSVAAAAGLSRAAAVARLHWYHAGAVARDDPRAARELARIAAATAPRSLASRPALGALARLVLPRALDRLLP